MKPDKTTFLTEYFSNRGNVSSSRVNGGLAMFLIIFMIIAYLLGFTYPEYMFIALVSIVLGEGAVKIIGERKHRNRQFNEDNAEQNNDNTDGKF